MKECFIKYFASIVIMAVLIIGVCNFISQMYHAENKDFWLDEEYSLRATIKANSYLGLLGKKAAVSEANAAPLDYIFTKIFDDMKQKVHAFGVSDKVYYRLWANFIMVFCGLVVVCLFAIEIVRSSTSSPIKLFQLLFLVFVPFVYLYRPLTYHFAAEVRPYASWFAWWFITVGVCSLKSRSKLVLALFLSLLAMTMVGSIFQILAVLLAFFIVECHENGCKQAVMNSLKVFTIPIILVVFYAFPAAYGHRSDEPSGVVWHRFFSWWNHELIIIPMLLFVMVSLYQSKKNRTMIIGPLAVLFVFLMGPLIVQTTLWRGYFYTERQYIYYDAHRAVFWLGLINILPFYLEKIKSPKKQVIAMAVILALWMPFVFSKKTIIYIQAAIHHTTVDLTTPK